MKKPTPLEHLNRPRIVAVTALLMLASASGLAQRLPQPADESGTAIQRRQQQQIESSKPPQPDVLSPSTPGGVRVELANLPAETPCFVVKRVVLTGNVFGWLPQFLQPATGQCVGKQAVKRIQDSANNELIARGWITSRVLVPQQSLEGGTLTLQVVPGRVSELHASGPEIGVLRAALPTKPTAPLNQRDLDQGLENLRRLPSQADATFDIAPGATPGDSEIVLHPGTAKRWHATVGLDNAGLKSTGKYELSGAFTYDSPLHLYDLLQFSGTTNANFGDPDKGAESLAMTYSVPIGYALVTFDASRSRYLQTVPGFGEAIAYSGVQSRMGLGASGVIWRNAHARTEVHGKLFHELNENVVDGVDVAVQHRDLIGYELGLSHRQYVGNVQLDGALAWRASLPGLSNDSGTVIGDPAFNGHTRVQTASFSAQAPFKLGSQPFSYRFAWNTQNARTPLTAPDYFTIGTRYAVRGFDQQLTLAAESGWVVSNEIDWYAPTSLGTQALYTGIDAGRVRGPSAQWLLGQTLVGTVVGARGSLAPKNVLGASLGYDVSLGWPLAKPQGFPDKSPTLLIQLSGLF